MVFTTQRFIFSLALLFVVVFFFPFLFTIVITSIGEDSAGLCVSRAFVCFIYTRKFLSFFSSSWCQGLAASCVFDTPWTFLLMFCLRFAVGMC